MALVALEGVAEKLVAHTEHHHPKVALDRTVQLLKVVHFVLKFDHMIMVFENCTTKRNIMSPLSI